MLKNCSRNKENLILRRYSPSQQDIIYFRVFLTADYARDKSLFVADVNFYRSMRFESARRKLARLIYLRYVAAIDCDSDAACAVVNTDPKFKNMSLADYYAENKGTQSFDALFSNSSSMLGGGGGGAGGGGGSSNNSSSGGSVGGTHLGVGGNSDGHALMNTPDPLSHNTMNTQASQPRLGSSSNDVVPIQVEPKSTLIQSEMMSNGGAGVIISTNTRLHTTETQAPMSTTLKSRHQQQVRNDSLLQMGYNNNAIGVYGSSVRRVRSRLLSSSSPSDSAARDLFDDVAREVLADLKLDAFPRFIRSPFYQRYIRTKFIETVPVAVGDFMTFRVLGRGGFGAVHACRKKTAAPSMR